MNVSKGQHTRVKSASFCVLFLVLQAADGGTWPMVLPATHQPAIAVPALAIAILAMVIAVGGATATAGKRCY